MKKSFTFLLILLVIGITSGLAQDTIVTQDTVITEQPVEQEQVAPQQDTVVPVQATEPAPTAEPKEKKSRKDKIYFGGYVNLSFGKYTVIGIEPMIGYKLTEKLSIGAKFRYDYIQDKRYSETYNTSTYGASVFARLKVLRNLYAHVEYAGYNYELYNDLGDSDREWVPFLFLGAGYTRSLGGRTSINVQIMFDVLQDDSSPYKSVEPFYSVGIGVGF